MTTELTDRDRAMLDFESRWWLLRGTKEDAIRAEFKMSPTRYAQILMRLIDTEAAVRYDAMLVYRLQDLRDERLAQRTLRRPAA